jgi:ATP-dependent DNA helicase RecG
MLPYLITIDTLFKKHPSIPYNPLIASAFFRAGYIEAWGSGIEKITNECRLAMYLYQSLFTSSRD